MSGPSSDIPGLETQSLRQADRRSSTRVSIGFPGYDPPTHLANPVCRDIDDARPGQALPGGRSEDTVVTLQIRWFFERSMPDKAVSWFQGEALGEFRPSTEQRTDVYLLTPDEDFRFPSSWRVSRRKQEAESSAQTQDFRRGRSLCLRARGRSSSARRPRIAARATICGSSIPCPHRCVPTRMMFHSLR